MEYAKKINPIVTINSPNPPGRDWSKATAVNSAPVIPDVHNPLESKTKPVMVHTTIVSINVWVIDTSACLTGFGVRVAAAAMGAEPRPDSFEKIPRAIPSLTAIMTVAPKNPPVAAEGVKADLKIRAKMPGREEMFIKRIMTRL